MALDQNKIDYDQVLDILSQDFYEIIQNDESGLYENLQLKISSERMFIKKKPGELENDTIYIVVKFSPASVTFGQTVLPITIVALAENNGKDTCWRLFQDFAAVFNLEQTGDVKQYYESPSVSSNFDEAFTGFKSVLSMSGLMVISKDANPFDIYYLYNEEVNGVVTEQSVKIESLQNDFDLNLQTDPQPFYSENNFTKSIVKFGTITVNIVTYLLKNNKFLDDALKIAIHKKTTGDVNKTFKLRLEWASGDVLEDNFKIAHYGAKQVLKELPVVTITVTN